MLSQPSAGTVVRFLVTVTAYGPIPHGILRFIHSPELRLVERPPERRLDLKFGEPFSFSFAVQTPSIPKDARYWVSPLLVKPHEGGQEVSMGLLPFTVGQPGPETSPYRTLRGDGHITTIAPTVVPRRP